MGDRMAGQRRAGSLHSSHCAFEVSLGTTLIVLARLSLDCSTERQANTGALIHKRGICCTSSSELRTLRQALEIELLEGALLKARIVGIGSPRSVSRPLRFVLGQTLSSGVPRSASALPGSSPKADRPLTMSWTALHPTCGNHRGLSAKERQDGDHYDDRVGYREVGVSGARDRCGRRSGGAPAPEPGPCPGVLREAAAMLGRDGGV